MKYLYTIKMSFIQGMSFKSRIPITIIEQLIFILVNYFIWKTVANNGNVGDFSSEQLITYSIMVWIISAIIDNSADFRLEKSFSKGNVVFNMTRPANMFLYEICIELGRAFFGFIFGALPCFVICSIFIKLQFPQNISILLIFILSVFNSFIILTSINYLISLLIFYMESIQGVKMLKNIIIDLASGLLIPVTFYPELVQKIFVFLPFQYIYNTPLQIFTKNYSVGESLGLLSIQALWVIGLIILSEISTAISRRKITILGG